MTVAVRQARCVFPRRRSEPVVALDGVSLDVADGELVVVVGPSGSGKTTLLRAIAGLETLESGQVLIDGRDVSAEPPARRRVAMVFQEYALLPHLTVFENVAFGMRARGVPRDEVARSVTGALQLLDIAQLVERRPGELSGGQRQRVALARAMVRHPAVFLLDEPLSSLDTELRLRARTETRSLQRRLGVATVYVTHDQHEAMALADRVVVLRAGGVEQEGAPADLYAEPANAFVARFLAALPMNLVPGEQVGQRGDHVVGVRPERIRVVAGEGRLTGRVLAVEPAGDDAVVHVLCGAQRLLVRLAWPDRPAADDLVALSWAATDEHRFTSVDGPRLP